MTFLCLSSTRRPASTRAALKEASVRTSLIFSRSSGPSSTMKPARLRQDLAGDLPEIFHVGAENHRGADEEGLKEVLPAVGGQASSDEGDEAPRVKGDEVSHCVDEDHRSPDIGAGLFEARVADGCEGVRKLPFNRGDQGQLPWGHEYAQAGEFVSERLHDADEDGELSFPYAAEDDALLFGARRGEVLCLAAVLQISRDYYSWRRACPGRRTFGALSSDWASTRSTEEKRRRRKKERRR